MNQVELENMTREEMKDRARKLLEVSKDNGSLGEQKVFKRLISVFANELTTILSQYVVDIEAGKAKRKPIQITPIVKLGADLVAYEAISALFGYTKKGYFTTNGYCHALGQRLEMLYEIQILSNSEHKEDRDIPKQILKLLQRSSYTGKRRDKMVSNLIAKYSKMESGISKDTFTKLARFCLDIVTDLSVVFGDGIERSIAHCNIDKTSQRGKAKVLSFITLPPWVMQGALELIENGFFLSNIFKPMIEVPRDHGTEEQGGYYTKTFKYNVVQSSFKAKSIPSQLNYNAINTLQKVPYRINKEVFKVYKELVESYDAVAGLARPIEVERIEELGILAEVKERDEQQETRYKSLRKTLALQYKEQTASNSKVLAQFRVLHDAETFLDYDAFYFTYYFDYRGRLYTKSSNLSTQGSDYNKALIEFAEGVKIGDEYGELYLSIHGANCYGMDKLSEADKYQWVQDNKQLILAVANSPLDSLDLWIDCDEPFSFLAFCMDYRGFMLNGFDHVSHLSIALDGSCNGLQHLSAMRLDEVGGKEVNLIPMEVKADIYTSVASRTYDKLLAEKTDLSEKILKFIVFADKKKTRKLAKKPTMTFAYASTLDNCLKNVRDIFIEHGGNSYFGDDLNDAVRLTAITLWDSVQSKILKGSEIMDYLKNVCRLLLKDNVKRISWHTPMGFEVIQARPKEFRKNLEVTLIGDSRRAQLNTTKKNHDKLSPKNVAAIAPNFIHSLDANHLQATVNSCYAQGIKDFVMIHDSFGTHAGNSKVLADTLREEFVNMYLTDDILSGFIEEQGAKLKEDLDKKNINMPTNGQLNLRDITKSEYFFS